MGSDTSLWQFIVITRAQQCPYLEVSESHESQARHDGAECESQDGGGQHHILVLRSDSVNDLLGPVMFEARVLFVIRRCPMGSRCVQYTCLFGVHAMHFLAITTRVGLHQMQKGDHLDHHAPITAFEGTTAKRVDQL